MSDLAQELIAETCDMIKEMLLEKNRKYGNSALEPSRIFSRSDAIEQIKVRIDDKLTRLRNQQDDEDEDVVMDLMGYLVLLRVAKGMATSTGEKGTDVPLPTEPEVPDLSDLVWEPMPYFPNIAPTYPPYTPYIWNTHHYIVSE